MGLDQFFKFLNRFGGQLIDPIEDCEIGLFDLFAKDVLSLGRKASFT